MNEQNKKNQQGNHVGAVSFVNFWRFIAKSLGDSRLRIRNEADSIETLLASNSDHREFLREVIITSYFESNCCSIDDLIDMNTTLDVMGEAAYQLQGRNKDDLMDIELLEEIAYLIQQQYFYLIDVAKPIDNDRRDGLFGAIVTFSNRKIRRANTKL